MLTWIAILLPIAIFTFIILFFSERLRPYVVMIGRVVLCLVMAAFFTWMTIETKVYPLLVLPILCIIFAIFIIRIGPDDD